ncbi:hypothetical protein C8A03DRAFT_33329 [Achaetomium macrosporum]|uniref:Uncharacterized protein n=1 Tax=Achaetomium macrosporum TaxID=79813 RepID=A0AAN7CAW0_9PEZI|nr:hypothetical protein C8A03DRAFT_33329 [Achaetomium macrosporum]
MGGTRPPFIYQAVKKDDDRFPATPFDPKAVTRASYEAKKSKPKPNGPLVSFNRHPDAHMVPSGRSKYKPMGRKTKGWIKGMRTVQLCLRILEVIGAVGLVVVMSIAGLLGWVIGVTLGLVVLHCLYSIFHHARPAGLRTPGSSAAYHVFSAISDLCVLPLYAYGAFTTRNKGEEWKTTDMANTNVMRYMVPSVYYGLIGAGGLHVLSLAISLFLGVMFRRISMMPPDMNPLEANLTSRVHKRNKSSVATTSTYSDGEKHDSQLYDEHSRPPSVPFMHTRQGSETSFDSEDSRLNLPSRQYQVAPSNRSSASPQTLKRMSAPPTANRASYMEIPLSETGASPSRPTSMYSTPEGRPGSGSVAPATQTTQPRPAKFTETWYASESLINRTQQRNRAANRAGGSSSNSSPQRAGTRYESLRQNLDASDSEDDNDNNNNHNNNNDYYNYRTNENAHHPNPLRSHPTTTTPSAPAARRPRTPFSRLRASVLSEISLNDRRVSGSQDITDSAASSYGYGGAKRVSSIQADDAFYSKPYGELKAATPPIMVGPSGLSVGNVNGNGNANGRVVSSGNDYDYDLGQMGSRRRDVSGKVVEEGRSRGMVF